MLDISSALNGLIDSLTGKLEEGVVLTRKDNLTIASKIDYIAKQIEAIDFGQKPTDEQVEEAVTSWLNDHPEATTTVQDNSITVNKLDNNLKSVVTNDTFSNDAKGKLIDVFSNVAYTIADGSEVLDSLVKALDLEGTIQIYKNMTLDENSGEASTYVNGTRCISDYIDVDSVTSIVGKFNEGAPIYAVSCYDEDREYLGRAEDYNHGTGPISGQYSRTLKTNTKYIRLLCVDASKENLADEYTGNIITFTFNGDQTNTAKYCFTEDRS